MRAVFHARPAVHGWPGGAGCRLGGVAAALLAVGGLIGEVLFDKICRKNGIAHRLTAPASPNQNGKVERFHGHLPPRLPRHRRADTTGA
jgi:hypothetical protein